MCIGRASKNKHISKKCLKMVELCAQNLEPRSYVHEIKIIKDTYMIM